MDSPSCAVCGQPIVRASGSPTPSPSLSLFFLGRRWVFCGAACRLVFKRDAARVAREHPDRGLTPYPDAVPLPPRPDRQSPFAGLLKAGPASAAVETSARAGAAELAPATTLAGAPDPARPGAPEDQGET